MKNNLTDKEFALISNRLTSHFGFNFADDRKSALVRSLMLATRDFGFPDLNALIEWILSPAQSNKDIERLAPYLTNSETYFWREASVFKAFTQHVLPGLMASDADLKKNLRIWCAGCSTGEEAYSIAIALHRTIPQIREWKITILATDINETSLQKAQKGVYSSRSFRDSPSWLKNNYFKIVNTKEFEVNQEIREMVRFSKFNLTTPNFKNTICSGKPIDIIFCRNVLMYFSGEWASKISRNFFDCLTDNGMLVVSSCELSVNLFPQFRPDNYPGAVLYRKINTINNEYNPAFLITSELLVQNMDLEKNHRSPDILIKDSAHLPIVILEKTTKPQMLVSSSEDSANVKQNQIRTLINESKLDRALDECNDAIESEKLSANLYFLRASIYKELKKYNEATVSLKQAIYIKPEYVMGHFALGNLYEIQGHAIKARRSFKNALELLNELPNNALVEEFEGMPAIHIRTIILANLQTQKVF